MKKWIGLAERVTQDDMIKSYNLIGRVLNWPVESKKTDVVPLPVSPRSTTPSPTSTETLLAKILTEVQDLKRKNSDLTKKIDSIKEDCRSVRRLGRKLKGIANKAKRVSVEYTSDEEEALEVEVSPSDQEIGKSDGSATGSGSESPATKKRK